MSRKPATPVPAAPPRVPAATAERPHLLDLLLSLVDARISHVDLMDTTAEEEIERYYRARRNAHRATRQ